MLREKRKRGPRKKILGKKTNCRVDENTESCNISLKIALDSINKKVKEEIIVSQI